MSDVKFHPSQLLACGGTRESTRNVEMTEMVSASPHAQWWERDDPYWQQFLFESEPSFYAKYQAKYGRIDESGRVAFARLDDFDDPDRMQWKRAWKSALNSEKTQRVLALLYGLHHANTKQVVSWIGYNPTKIYRILRPLFDFGITERGHYRLDKQRPGRLAQLHTLHNGQPLERWFEQRQERDTRRDENVVSKILEGQHRQPKFANPGAQFVRHNMLAVEVMLRMMEVNPVWVDAASERASRPRLLLDGNKDAPMMPADGTLWRDDGLRIMFEVVSSRDEEHIANKIRRWAAWFATMPLNATGTVLVMLNAHRDRHTNVASAMRRMHREIIHTGTLHTIDGRPATDDEVIRARQQIHLASWEDWFPKIGHMSAMGLDCTTAVTSTGRNWGPVRLADHGEVPYDGRVYTSPSQRGTLLTPPWAGAFPIHSYDPDIRYGRNLKTDREREQRKAEEQEQLDALLADAIGPNSDFDEKYD